MATALSSPSRLPSSAGDEGIDRDEGTRPFEALDGWDDPYLRASRDNDGDGEEGAGGGIVGRPRKARATPTGAVRGIGVSIEEVRCRGELNRRVVFVACQDLCERMPRTVRVSLPVFSIAKLGLAGFGLTSVYLPRWGNNTASTTKTLMDALHNPHPCTPPPVEPGGGGVVNAYRGASTRPQRRPGGRTMG